MTRGKFMKTKLMLTAALILMAACTQRNSQSFYAVTLNNNSLYFGHLTKVTPDDLELSQVYYLQKVPASEDGAQPKLTVVKQSKDLIGPSDFMTLNRQNVISYQELRDDSAVVKEIKRQEELAAKKNAVTQDSASPQTPSQFIYRPQPQFHFDKQGFMSSNADEAKP